MLEALEEQDNVLLFSEVRYGHKKEFTGFPTAEFYKKAGGGRVADTHSNERTWSYTLLLIYEFTGNKTRAEAETILDTAVDMVNEAFDKNSDLSGNCMKVDVAEENFYDIMLEEPFIFAEFTITIHDFVDRA